VSLIIVRHYYLETRASQKNSRRRDLLKFERLKTEKMSRKCRSCQLLSGLVTSLAREAVLEPRAFLFQKRNNGVHLGTN